MELERAVILILGALSVPVAAQAIATTKVATYSTVIFPLPTDIDYLPIYAPVVESDATAMTFTAKYSCDDLDGFVPCEVAATGSEVVSFTHGPETYHDLFTWDQWTREIGCSFDDSATAVCSTTHDVSGIPMTATSTVTDFITQTIIITEPDAAVPHASGQLKLVLAGVAMAMTLAAAF